MRLAWAVFAKSAWPGAVKTRLALTHGERNALLVHRWLVRRTLGVVGARPGRHTLWTHPDGGDPWTRRLARDGGWETFPQRGEDLGARMAHAAASLLAHASAVVLVGTDLPTLSGEVLAALVRALESGAETVFVPAYDGGYGALGLRRLEPALFHAIPWGGSEVLRTSRLALRARGRDAVLLPPLPDWDRPEDLALFAPSLPRGLVRRFGADGTRVGGRAA